MRAGSIASPAEEKMGMPKPSTPTMKFAPMVVTRSYRRNNMLITRPKTKRTGMVRHGSNVPNGSCQIESAANVHNAVENKTPGNERPIRSLRKERKKRRNTISAKTACPNATMIGCSPLTKESGTPPLSPTNTDECPNRIMPHAVNVTTPLRIPPHAYPRRMLTPRSCVKKRRISTLSAAFSFHGHRLRDDDSPTLQPAKTIAARNTWRMQTLSTVTTILVLNGFRSPIPQVEPIAGNWFSSATAETAKMPMNTIIPVRVPTSPS